MTIKEKLDLYHAENTKTYNRYLSELYVADYAALKLHKIRNVDRDECTCEQKIAYNMARYSRSEHYNALQTDSEREAYIADEIGARLNHWEEWYATDSKMNALAIFYILRNGLADYLRAGSPIAWNYSDVGKYFPT